MHSLADETTVGKNLDLDLFDVVDATCCVLAAEASVLKVRLLPALGFFTRLERTRVVVLVVAARTSGHAVDLVSLFHDSLPIDVDVDALALTNDVV